jgi:undecaprenyl-phosphate 4-deoxy-4-formamido-L-arabinose transferase
MNVDASTTSPVVDLQSADLEPVDGGISVVVPVNQSEKTLPWLAEELASALPTLVAHYELILVNDGRPDDSWRVIERLARRFAFVRGVKLMRNYGQHNATHCGNCRKCG